MSPEPNQLALRLAKQIEGSGSISVAEYMRAANAEYYSKSDPLGVDGDFITAPEISQMFGEMVGMWLTDIWLRQNSPANCHYVELGPGRGTLASDALRTLKRFDFEPTVHFVETSELLRAKQVQAVPEANFCQSIDEIPDNGPLLIVANEFFDALAVRQLISTHSGWRERVVGRDRGTKFIAMPGSQAMDAAIPPAYRNSGVGSIYETSPDTTKFVYELAARIEKQGGVFLIIDYGYAQPGLGSTLQAVKNHQYADPFDDPGNHDLTAHVNFFEIANLARTLDLRVNGPVDQGAWLEALGLEQRAATIADASPDRAGEIFEAHDRLVGDDAMGSLFKVLAIRAPSWPEPEGFTTRRKDLGDEDHIFS